MSVKASRPVLRVALYGRVSSEQQAERQTIASQVAALKERVMVDGLTVEPELCFFDEGYSGSNLQRPALERLRDRAYSGEIDRLYVHSPDRLARKYAYQVLLLEELQRHGVEVVFLNHAIGTSPEEDLLLQMQGMIAEYERAKIVERSRRGKRHAAQTGRVAVLSGAPFGYRYVGKFQGGGCTAYEVMPEQARVVQQIFAWVGYDRHSIGEVCRRLKAQGVTSPKGKPYWDRTTVWGILKNPAYRGQAAFGKTRVGERRQQLRVTRQQSMSKHRAFSTYDTPESERIVIPVPALVDEALFVAVQEQLTENRRKNRQQKRGARYLLQGVLECGCCGYAYYGKPTSRKSARGRLPYTYYRCVGADAYRFGGTRVCENRQVRTDPLDAAVWQDVQQLLRNPVELRQEFERRQQSSGTDPALRVQLDKQIAHQQRAVNRLIDAYENGVLDRHEFEPRLSKAKDRLQHLRESAAELDAQQLSPKRCLTPRPTWKRLPRSSPTTWPLPIGQRVERLSALW
jgi:site-specific DNA recombinase